MGRNIISISHIVSEGEHLENIKWNTVEFGQIHRRSLSKQHNTFLEDKTSTAVDTHNI